MRRGVSIASSTLVVALVLAGCSSDGATGDDGSVAGPAGSVDPATTATDSPTDGTTAERAPGGTAGPQGEPEGTTGNGSRTAPPGGAARGVVRVELDEWTIEAPRRYAPGEITFRVANGGTLTHELLVVRGDDYAALPLEASGAVILDELPEGAVIGRTPRIEAGESARLRVRADPGRYLLLCNLTTGSASHAAQGQRLGITVG